MHPCMFSGPKTDEQIKYLTKEWLIGVFFFIIIFGGVALTQDFVKDSLYNFIEWSCSANGTLDIEAIFNKVIK